MKKTVVGKLACALGLIPALIFAYEYGPPQGHTGAPGDNKTACIDSGCHVGTVNSFGGSVTIASSGGSTYTPGVVQHLMVTIADPSQNGAGFQITARLASETSNYTQQGHFTSTDSLTNVLCADGAKTPCNSTFPLEYVQHLLAGWNASKGPKTYTYTFDWTPPATNVGNIVLYAAGNASSNGTTSQTAGHIYTTSLTLTPAASGGGNTPSISSSGGVVNGATFATSSNVAPNTYITIKGTNLAASTRSWAGSDFGSSGTTLPTSLDGTSVMVNGKAAYVEYISPTQINAITPSDSATGTVSVTVTTNSQTSGASSVTLQSTSPGFFTFDGKYVAAGDATTGAYIGKTGLFSSAPNLTTPAKPGQLITLYGTGFGATTPAISAGIVTDKVYNLSPVPTFNIGGTTVTPSFAGLVPPFAQVYQFNVQIPSNAPDGDLQIFAQTNGVSTMNNSTCCFVTVQK